jgi:hypothetical protein
LILRFPRLRRKLSPQLFDQILPKLLAPIHHHVLELGLLQLVDKQVRVEPTDSWEQLKLLCGWIEQERYEEIRPLALFGSSVVQHAMEGAPRRAPSTLVCGRGFLENPKVMRCQKCQKPLGAPFCHFWHPAG